MIKIEVPATTTNFGSGFDTFGLSVQLSNNFFVEFSKEFTVEVSGYKSGIPVNENNLFIKVYKRVCEKIGEVPLPIKLLQENNIPPARGLGSSATAIVGAIEGTLALFNKKISLEDKIKIAFEFEPHPDNVIPALVGGFTVCVTTETGILFKRLNFPEELKLVFVIPDYEVPTSEARRVLPDVIKLEDTVFNIQRSALLVSALLTKDYKLLREAVKDKIHQIYREKLVPGLGKAIEESYKKGALATFLSGAGPTICSIVLEKEEDIGQTIKEIVENASGHNAQVKVLKATNTGVKVFS